MISKKYSVVDTRRCVSCGTCSKECPKDAIYIHKGCYAAVDTELYIGCCLCTRTCPADCIDLVEREVVS